VGAGTATQGDRISDGGGGGRLTRLNPRALRRADIRIFSSASDAPNARRPTDVILLIVSVVGVVTLSFLAPGPTAIDRTVHDLVQELPGLLGGSEAALTAGLVALGVPNAAAMSTAIAYRLVTFYLPPIWGSLATRWLKQHQYL
jgi:hypothetical protein